MNIFKNTLVLVILIFPILIVSIINYWLYQQEEFDSKMKENMNIVNLYKKIWRYHIWKRNSWWGFGWPWINRDAICDFISKNCIHWVLKWVTVQQDVVYAYFLPQNHDINFELSTRWEDYPMLYTIFGNESIDTPEIFENLKIYWILRQESIDFYSSNELKYVSQREQDILLELRKKPRFEL